MKFTHLTLENFRCFARSDTNFDEGVTVIHGVNGAGKSSLLEACFFALYGSSALEQGENLENVITKGETTASIELRFTHNQNTYHLHREIKYSTTTERAITSTCTLERNGSHIADGATPVENTIHDILRMDAESFLNCAYVRQGAITKLIDASPSERQDMIDELLQLGKLETYRERASKARIGIKRSREQRQQQLDNLEAKLDGTDTDSIQSALDELNDTISAVEKDIEQFTQTRKTWENKRDTASDTIEDITEKQDDLEEAIEDVAELNQEIQSRQEKREELQSKLDTAEDELTDLQSQFTATIEESSFDQVEQSAIESDIESVESSIEEVESSLNDVERKHQAAVTDANTFEDTAAELRERAETHREKAQEVSDDIASKQQKIEETRTDLDEKRDTIEDAKAKFNDRPEGVSVEFGNAATAVERVTEELDSVNTERTEIEQKIHTLKTSIEDAETLLEEGHCPECGQDVEHSPHVEGLEADKEELNEKQTRVSELKQQEQTLEERLSVLEELVDAEEYVESTEDEINTLSSLLDEREEDIASLEETQHEHETSSADLKNRAATLDTRTKQLQSFTTTLDDTIDTLETQRDTLEATRDDLQEALNIYDQINTVQTTINITTDRIEDIDSTIDTFREQLTEKAETVETLREQVDETRLENAENTHEKATACIERLNTRITQLEAYKETLTGERGGLKNQLEHIRDLEEEHEEVEAAVERLNTAYDEAEELETMYSDLRHELRQKNVKHLEKLLNDIFDLVFENDSYAHIELSDEYEFTVYEKTGETLDPTDLSGGEQALFNMSLRTAIYQLLIEGSEETPMPPLILDEPTVHLDDNHVDRISDLVSRMRDLGVEQTLVISHNDEIVEAADERILVEKDPKTNRSTVNVQSKNLLNQI